MKLRLAPVGTVGTVGTVGLAAIITARSLRDAAASPEEVATRLSGDDLVPDATVSMDRAATFDVPPEVLWPWIAQLGKGRGGWYFPRWLDALTPRDRRALRRIDPTLTRIRVGDDHSDWGPGAPVLRVTAVEPGRTIVYHSLRARAQNYGWPRDDDADRGVFAMSWQLVLTPVGDRTRLHLRVRARARTRVFGVLGDLFDGLTVVLLFDGLRERLDRTAGSPHQLGSSGVNSMNE